MMETIGQTAGQIWNYLNENGFVNTEIFTINDSLKDYEYLPIDIFNKLKGKCDELKITHLIISTEPKAHFMYLNFALKNNINVLTDKPITVSKNMTSLSNIDKVRKQYYEILELAKASKGSCKVMCQRQYHRGYEKIKELLIQVVDKFKMPITKKTTAIANEISPTKNNAFELSFLSLL